MVVLGLLLVVVGLIGQISLLVTLGVLLVVVGLVLGIVGSTGRSVGGRAYWF
jgi:hypothetical protein